jgi:hypothetical protein
MCWPVLRCLARTSPVVMPDGARLKDHLPNRVYSDAVWLQVGPLSAKVLGMKTRLFRTIEVLLTVAILVVAVHLLLILYFAQYSFSLSFLTIQAQKVAPPTILLMALILSRVLMLCCVSSGKDLSAYIPAILFCTFMILYLANGVTKWVGDTLPARYLPFSILREGNFDLNEFQFLYAQKIPYYLIPLNGRYLSLYPVGPAIAALPFYLIPALGGIPPTDGLLEDLEKLAAASMVALSACILYLALRRLAGGRVLLLLTVIYALGTSSFSVSSQALWQHGPSQLALTIGLYSLIRGREGPPWVGLAGFSLAFAVICRPTDLLLILPLGAYVLLYHRPQAGWFLLGMLPPGLFQLWYNYAYFHDPFFQPFGRAYWSTPLMEGLSGILLSPGRGLFIYSPVLLCSFLGIVLAWRRHGDPLLRALTVGILPTLLLYGKWVNWWGGWSYGPRLLADLTPILTVCLVPCALRLDAIRPHGWTLRGGRWLFGALALWSVWAHTLGALWDDSRWNASPPIDLSPQRLWFLRSSPLVEYGKDVFGRVWIAMGQFPTSRSAPHLLSAIYHLDPSSFDVVAPSTARECDVRLCITAVNTGQSIWLGRKWGDKGTVTLVWRWVKEGKEVPGFGGGQILRHDVFPGRSYKFQLPSLPVPSEPGQYLLEIQMASAYLGMFSRWGSGSSVIRVTVPTWTAEVLSQYLGGPVVASTNTPKLTFALDRASYHPGESLSIIYQLAGAEKPVQIDMYLALRQPDGEVSLAAVSGRGLITPTDRFRSEDPIDLDQRSRLAGVLSLPLTEKLPIGNYTLYLFITEAGSYQMLTKATAEFFLEP